MIVECIKNVYEEDDGNLWNKAGEKYDAMIDDDSYVIVNEEGMQHWIYSKGDKEMEDFFHEYFRIVEGKGISSRLEDIISEFYQAENLTVDEVLNEIAEHAVTFEQTLDEFQRLLHHLNKAI